MSSISLSNPSTPVRPFVLREVENPNAPSCLPPKTIRVVIVRHGECMNNTKDIMGSVCDEAHPDTANCLTEKGRKQAEAGAELLRGRLYGDEVFFSSPNTRARQTAEIVARAVGYPIENIVTEKDIQEMFFGDMEDHPFAEYKESLHGESRFVGGAPHGETGNQLMERDARLFTRLVTNPKLYGKTVVLYAHWYTAAQAIRLAGTPVERLGDRKVGNGESITFELRPQ